MAIRIDPSSYVPELPSAGGRRDVAHSGTKTTEVVREVETAAIAFVVGKTVGLKDRNRLAD
jgi:hypothetical protein